MWKLSAKATQKSLCYGELIHGDVVLGNGQASYIRAIDTVRAAWVKGGHKDLFICEDHAKVGMEWLEYEIASRIWDKLEEVNELKSPAGNLFCAVYKAMGENIDRHYRQPADDQDDADGSEASENGEPMAVEGGAEQEQAAREDEGAELNLNAEAERLTSPRRPERQPSPLDILAEAAAQAAPLPVGRPSPHSAPSPPYHSPSIHSQNDAASDVSTAVANVRHLRRRRSRSRSPDAKSDRSSARSHRDRRGRRNRVDELNQDREPSHLQDAIFAQERRRIERCHHIVAELENVTYAVSVGDMSFRVFDREAREINFVTHADGYRFIGGKMVFTRLRT